MFQLLRSAASVSGVQCCQCEVSKQAEESFDVSAAAFDEGIDINAVDLEKGIREDAPSEASTQSADDGNRSGRAATPPHSNSSGSPRMDEEESRAQKARLNALVMAFTRESLLGVDCKIFQKLGGGSASYESTPAKFFLDKAVTKMVVEGCGKKMSIPLIDVVEAYLHEDVTKHFPDFPDYRSRAVFIQHQASGCFGNVDWTGQSWLCLVVADETTQERFVTALNILRLYAEAIDTKQTSL